VPEAVSTDDFGEGDRPEIFTPIEQVAGAWTNWAQVTHGKHEFTIDFVRLDPFEATGVVVGRVSMSSLMTKQLIDALNVVWHDFVRGALPPEVFDGDE
jgi:hypothetical protein